MPSGTSITLTDGTLGIADYAFYGCSGLRSVTIPNSVVSIGDWAFAECYSLGRITIGNGVKTIGNSVFFEDDVLESVDIPNSVTSIGDYAFAYCENLHRVSIGSGVTAIGAKAFYTSNSLYSDMLTRIICYGTVPPMIVNSNCFTKRTYNRAKLLVPRRSVVAYAAADYWNMFAHIEGWGDTDKGDVNGDGEVNIMDVDAVISIILGNSASAEVMQRADVNEDGEINISDVDAIISIVLTGH